MHPASQQNSIPVDGMIHCRYSASSQTLAVRQSYIRTPRTSLSLDGVAGKRSSLKVDLQAGELNEIEQIANAFRESNSVPLNLHGQGSVAATVSGSMQNPKVQGQMSGSNLQVRNTAWKSLHTHFSAGASSINIEQGQLVPSGHGSISFQLNAGLQHWAFSPSSSLQAKLHASDLDAKQLAIVAGSTTQVSGTLSADIEGHGTELAPTGAGTIQLTKAAVGGESIESLKTDFQADGQTISAQANIALPAGSMSADLHYQPKQQAYDVNLRSTRIRLQDLDSVKAKNLQLNGTLTINASGRGTLKDPGLQTTLEIPRLAVRNQSVNNIKLIAGVANHLAKFNLDLRSGWNSCIVAGHDSTHGDYYADITANTQPIQIQPLLAMYAPAQAADLSGQTEFHGTLRGPLKHKDQLEAHLEIPQFTLNYKNSMKLAAYRADPCRLRARHLDVNGHRFAAREPILHFRQIYPARKTPRSRFFCRAVSICNLRNC